MTEVYGNFKSGAIENCPFCGNPAAIKNTYEEILDATISTVVCPKCGARGPYRRTEGYIKEYSTDLSIAEIGAIMAWNRREHERLEDIR